MKLFKTYIIQNLRAMVRFLLFSVIFLVTFTLYHFPINAIIYPTLLCFLLWIGYLIVDFRRIQRKHQTLCQIKKLNARMIDEMPEITSIDDSDYQEIIQNLCEELKQLDTDTNERYQNMIDYYTIWAHQIKTPISSMHLTLQNEDSDLSRALSYELLRIEQYVEMVLAFLRLGSDSKDFVFKEHSLDAILRQSIKKFATQFIRRKIRLDYEPTNYQLVTDDKWLSFVIEQILSNALKYTKEGCITISMRDSNTLVIKDTGIGIAPEDLPRIFEKGYTGLNGRIDQKASGLGLYLCKQICQQLEISIFAGSTLGEGTEICLRLDQYHIQKE